MCEERARRPNNAAPNERSGLSEWSGGWIAGGLVPLLRSRKIMTQRRRSPAKPDGLGDVVSNLNGAAVIFSGGLAFSAGA